MSSEHHEFSDDAAWRHGEFSGTAVVDGALRLGSPAGVQDGGEYAWWTSPEHELPFEAVEFLPSWNATAPPGTWLAVEVRARTTGDRNTAWFSLGRWSHDESTVRRTSVPGQADEFARVAVDRVTAVGPARFRAYQVRVTLCRAEGTRASPALSAVGVTASAAGPDSDVPSAPGPARGIELPVPRHAQMIHSGHFSEFGGGGAHWCAPACTEMVVEYWGVGPAAADLDWITSERPGRGVVYAARHTFDHAYDGTGNWAFNVAYASRYGLRGRVTRLPSLTEAEHHVAAGVPVVVSLSFAEGELDGADYGSAGHLMVITGFTPTGDVVVNDPATADPALVRRIYPRAQFEAVWLRGRASTAPEAPAAPGGVCYLIAAPRSGATVRAFPD
ncbi:hypothetical protein B1813_10895 [Saccharomonospora piscinae]|uniref:Peptidase C39-like domain-containing protein n=1 Tax=Saccharomonospora piscinae TaxID=687388 RepID=A0A1V9A6V5_SACPI|nr:C39 family peptidase [Saccharomonospora piscinae]OQO92664.1 hypothetical protein B1813_10895 [Saccharomonospora piscinae]